MRLIITKALFIDNTMSLLLITLFNCQLKKNCYRLLYFNNIGLLVLKRFADGSLMKRLADGELFADEMFGRLEV